MVKHFSFRAKRKNLPVTIDKLYLLYRESKGVKLHYDLEPNSIEPGDLYFASKLPSELLPSQGILRILLKIWRVSEIYLPYLLKPIVPLLRKYTRHSFFLVDGNAYAKKAIKKGASYAVIDDTRLKSGPEYLLVENTHEALRNLATHHRKNMDTEFIGITGSCGKTTTKEMITSVLSTTFSVESTIDTSNTVPWIPQRILNFNEATDIGVIEMGAMLVGSIRKHCEVAQPHCGVITCIGKAHLESFKSMERVIRAKNELFEYVVSNNGHIFKNLNDSRVANLVPNYKKVTTYGSTEDADIQGHIIKPFPFLTIRWYPSKKSKIEYFDVPTRLYGEYNLDNLLSSISVGLYYDVEPKLINEAIQEYETIDLRSQIIKLGNNTIILDAYNANPTSMRAALSNFSKMKAEKKVVIIGDMLELGKYSLEEHRDMIFFTKNLNFSATAFLGEEFAKARDPNFGLYFSKIRTAKKWFFKQNFINAHILLKASRGIAIERIIDRK